VRYVEIRWYIDADTDLPHIYSHNLDEEEVLDVLASPVERLRGRGNSVIVHGQTAAGRYLKVICVPDADGNGIFIITAYDLTRRQLKALRRRLRRKPR